MSTDGWDYLAATSIGVACGALDSVFVGAADDGRSNTQSVLGAWTDERYAALVRGFAKLQGWKPSQGGEGDTHAAIGFLEKAYKVAYDQHRADATGGAVDGLSPKNHHYHQPGHSPDLMGLVTAVRDELDGKATFFKDGKVVRIDAEPLFAKAPNHVRVALIAWRWFGHVVSDIAGASSTGGRGMGLPAPLVSCLQALDFDKIDIVGFNKALEKAYEGGYDVRFATATAIPVILEETLLRAFWVIRQCCRHDRPVNECLIEVLPGQAPTDLKNLLLVANSALCIIDLADAVIRSDDPVTFISRLSYVAWARLAMLAVSRVSDELGEQLGAVLAKIEAACIEEYERVELAKVEAYRARMQELVRRYTDWKNEAIALLEAEHTDYMLIAQSVVCEDLPTEARAANSVVLVQASGAEALESIDELDEFMDA